jgi:hypothetical protein
MGFDVFRRVLLQAFNRISWGLDYTLIEEI